MFRIIGADGKEYGPVTGDQVRQWIREGRANARTRILPEDATGWTVLGALPEFEDVLGRRPENIPPVGAYSTLPEDVLDRDYELDIGDCVSRGADLLKNNFGILFGAAAVCLLIQGAISGLGSIPFIGVLFSLGGLFVMGQLIAGLYLVTLKTLRRQPTEVGEVFAGFKSPYIRLLLCYLVSALLTGVAALPGLALVAAPVSVMIHKGSLDALMVGLAALGVLVLAIPVCYLATAWMFGLPLVLDKGLGFWQALETSRKVVNKHWLSVFGLLIVVSLINFAGVLLCCLGIFLSFPLGIGTIMVAYETLFSTDEALPA